MFDNHVNMKSYFNTPATGIIQKSHKKSFFHHMHFGSALWDYVSGPDAKYYKENDKRVIILQTLLTEEKTALVELVFEEDFENEEEEE